MDTASNDARHPSPSAALDHLASDYWELMLRRNPPMATDLGDHRFDDQLPDYSSSAREAFYQGIESLQQRYESLPAESLEGEQRVTHEVLGATLELDLLARKFLDEDWTINPLEGPLIWITEAPHRQPLYPYPALRMLIARLSQAPWLYERWHERLRAGMAIGTTAPRIGVERTISLIKRILEAEPSKSAFIPQVPRPSEMPGPAFDAARAAVEEVVRETVFPALRAHLAFMEEEYLPASREAPGLCTMPGGEAFYAHVIRHYTGTRLTAQQIHAIGREEIARLREEMIPIGASLTGSTRMQDIVGRLRARTDQYLQDGQSFLDFNMRLLARANEASPAFFTRLPTRQCEVRPIESFREIDSPSGFYSRAPDGGIRPAYYYVNTYHVSQRPLFNVEALAFHESVPGHHLQIAIAQDLENLPDFRRHLGPTAFVEGWALYAERLSDEMGLYSSQEARFGMLAYQVWRASRLVIDTGIHALGWSRERAIQEMLENTAHGEAEARIEVDRYTYMPGQALAYMIGRMALDGLRRRVRERLGPRFDIRTFHDRVLEHGAIPLPTLERLLDGWAEQVATTSSN